MNVLVEDALFADPGLKRELLDLLLLGLSHPHHHMQIEPPEGPSLRAWQETQTDPALAEWAQQVFDQGIKLEAESPSLATLHVVHKLRPEAVGQALRLSDALAWLRQPLSVLVEDVVSDGAFLRAVALGPWRERLFQMLAEGHLKLVHGGGTGSMRRQLEVQLARAPLPPRTFVLCDSDVLDPDNQHLNGSARLAHFCTERGVHCHRLQRRSIENYLPLPALDLWVATKRAQVAVRLLNAFRRLDPKQRYHFNMKKGLAGDRDREPEGGLALYADLRRSPFQWDSLQAGFGEDVAQLFVQHLETTPPGKRTFRLEESWLVEDGQAAEVKQLLDQLLALL